MIIGFIEHFMRKKQVKNNRNLIGPLIPKVMYIILKQKKSSHNIYAVLNQRLLNRFIKSMQSMKNPGNIYSQSLSW